MGDYGFYLIIALAVGAMWLMSSRTRRQQRAATDFRNHLVPGDEVMTGSGLVGTVVGVDGDIVTLESMPGSQSRWVLRAITQRMETPAAVAEDDESDDDGYEDEYDEDGEYDDIEVPDDVSSLTSSADASEDDDDLDDEDALDDEDDEDDDLDEDVHATDVDGDGTAPDQK